MRVRAYDDSTSTYFSSEVYAIINRGWYERHLLFVPSSNGGYIRLFDYHDKSDPKSYEVLINKIDSEVPSEWLFQTTDSLDETLPGFTELLSDDIRFFEFYGYPWIIEDKQLLVRLLNDEAILLKGSVFDNRTPGYRLEGWNYVETPEEVDDLLCQTSSFHDSVLREMKYISGSSVNSEKWMYPFDDVRQVTMLFDSQIGETVELVFEGTTALYLRPVGDSYTSEISCASLYLEDATVFFCIGEVLAFDEDYEDTFIMAYSLRWRFVPITDDGTADADEAPKYGRLLRSPPILSQVD